MRTRLIIRKLHRKAGLAASLFIVLLCISGIFLNHAGSLKLADIHLHNTALLAWYGIKPPAIKGFAIPATDDWISSDGANLYVNSRVIAPCNTMLAASFENNEYTIVCQNQTLILAANGELLESMESVDGSALSNSSSFSFNDAPLALQQSILHTSTAYSIDAERVLLDLHSGRWMGKVGIYIMDFAAILMILLTASGVWMTVKNKR